MSGIPVEVQYAQPPAQGFDAGSGAASRSRPTSHRRATITAVIVILVLVGGAVAAYFVFKHGHKRGNDSSAFDVNTACGDQVACMPGAFFDYASRSCVKGNVTCGSSSQCPASSPYCVNGACAPERSCVPEGETMLSTTAVCCAGNTPILNSSGCPVCTNTTGLECWDAPAFDPDGGKACPAEGQSCQQVPGQPPTCEAFKACRCDVECNVSEDGKVSLAGEMVCVEGACKPRSQTQNRQSAGLGAPCVPVSPPPSDDCAKYTEGCNSSLQGTCGSPSLVCNPKTYRCECCTYADSGTNSINGMNPLCATCIATQNSATVPMTVQPGAQCRSTSECGGGVCRFASQFPGHGSSGACVATTTCVTDDNCCAESGGTDWFCVGSGFGVRRIQDDGVSGNDIYVVDPDKRGSQAPRFCVPRVVSTITP